MSFLRSLEEKARPSPVPMNPSVGISRPTFSPCSRTAERDRVESHNPSSPTVVRTLCLCLESAAEPYISEPSRTSMATQGHSVIVKWTPANVALRLKLRLTRSGARTWSGRNLVVKRFFAL